MSYSLIIPAAGRGLRAFSFTGFGATPKPFVSVGGRTVFGLIVDEALDANISQLNLVVSDTEGEQVYRHFFDPFRQNPELRQSIAKKSPATIEIIDRNKTLAVEYFHQTDPLGFGHAVARAYPAIQNANFDGILVALGDDLVCGGPSGMAQLIEVHKQVGGMVFMVEEVDREAAKRFGVAQISDALPIEASCRETFRVSSVEEKPQDPKPNHIDGQDRYFAVAGRYLLEEEDLAFLHESQPTPGRELDFTPLFARNAAAGRLTAILPQGRFHTVGNAHDLQKAAVSYALDTWRTSSQSDFLAHTLEDLVNLGVLDPTKLLDAINPALQNTLAPHLKKTS